MDERACTFLFYLGFYNRIKIVCLMTPEQYTKEIICKEAKELQNEDFAQGMIYAVLLFGEYYGISRYEAILIEEFGEDYKVKMNEARKRLNSLNFI